MSHRATEVTDHPGQVSHARRCPQVLSVFTMLFHTALFWVKLGHKTATQLHHRRRHRILCYLMESTAEQVSKTETNYQQNQLPGLYFFTFYYLFVCLLMCIILSCHAAAYCSVASLQIPYTNRGTSLGYMQMRRRHLLTMPALPNA